MFNNFRSAVGPALLTVAGLVHATENFGQEPLRNLPRLPVLSPSSETFRLGKDRFSLNHAEQVVRYVGPPDIKTEVLQAASEAHARLSESWLGVRKPLPPLNLGVVITDEAPHGQATFTLGEAMHTVDVQVRARTEDVVTVIWHEMNHVVFRHHLGEGLPRWLDEGCAMTVERNDQQEILIKALVNNYLRANRGIAFNEMLSQVEFPVGNNAEPFYAQAMTAVQYLLSKHPDPNASLDERRQHLMAFAEDVIRRGRDSTACGHSLPQFYNIKSTSEFQIGWLADIRARYVRE